MNEFLQTNNLTKHLDGVIAVCDVSISIKQNTITSLIGSNGAGKTTLFNLLTFFMRADNGQIIFKNKVIDDRKKYQYIHRCVGRLWQDIRLFKNMSVFDNLLTSFQMNPGETFWGNILQAKKVRSIELKNEKKASEVLEFIDLEAHKNMLAGELSLGQQKRVAIGRLLVNDSELLLLDEPFSGLDNKNVDNTAKLIEKLISRGKTIFMIEHNIEKALSLSDWIFRMEAGKIVFSGRPLNYHEDSISFNKKRR